MKIKDGFLLKEITGEHVVVPVGENLVDFSAMIVLNNTGAFLWKFLKEDRQEEQLVLAVLEEYDVDKQTAQNDVKEFLKLLEDNRLVE